MLDGAGCRLQVYDYGNDGAPPMLLVHGIQDFALALQPLAEAFRDQYRVVSCDLRGHGDSDKPGVYTMAHYLADLRALFIQLEMEKPVLVGHSLGSQIVCQYGGVFPEVPRAIVSIDERLLRSVIVRSCARTCLGSRTKRPFRRLSIA